MAVAYQKFAVLNDNIFAGTFVFSGFFHCSAEHSVHFVTGGTEVKTVMISFLPGERIFSLSEWGIDKEVLQRK